MTGEDKWLRKRLGNVPNPSVFSGRQLCQATKLITMIEPDGMVLTSACGSVSDKKKVWLV